MPVIRLTIILFALLTANVVTADLLQQGFTAQYKVTHNNTYLGINTQKLSKITEKTWEYHTVSEPRGFFSMFVSDVITEHSTFQYYNDTIRPGGYLYLHKKRKNREKRKELDFDWDNNIVTNTVENTKFDLRKNTQDLMTFRLLLIQHLQKQQGDITIPIATRTGISDYVIRNKGEEILTLDVGGIPTVLMESDEYDGERYSIWFAKKLEYLPVKIQKIEDTGDRIVLELKSWSKLP